MNNCLIVIDDLMHGAVKDTALLSAFTEGSHHNNISVVFMMQNIFHKGTHARTMSINTQYMVLFKSSRDQQQIETLARQIFGKDHSRFLKFYHEQTSKPFGYVILDLHPNTSIKNRIVGQTATALEVKPAYEEMKDLRMAIKQPYVTPLLKTK